MDNVSSDVKCVVKMVSSCIILRRVFLEERFSEDVTGDSPWAVAVMVFTSRNKTENTVTQSSRRHCMEKSSTLPLPPIHRLANKTLNVSVCWTVWKGIKTKTVVMILIICHICIYIFSRYYKVLLISDHELVYRGKSKHSGIVGYVWINFFTNIIWR